MLKLVASPRAEKSMAEEQEESAEDTLGFSDSHMSSKNAVKACKIHSLYAEFSITKMHVIRRRPP